MIHCTAEEPPQDPTTTEFSDRKTCMTNHQGLIIMPATMARRPVFMSTDILYSLAYNDIDVMNDDKYATLLTAQLMVYCDHE